MNQNSQAKARRGVAAIRIAVLFGFLVPLLAMAGCQRSVVVNFPDPGLEAAIRYAVGKPTGDIHDTDLTKLLNLDANDQGIVDLEGIQHCLNLTELNLSSDRDADEVTKNKIVDISPLSALINLRCSAWTPTRSLTSRNC